MYATHYPLANINYRILRCLVQKVGLPKTGYLSQRLSSV